MIYTIGASMLTFPRGEWHDVCVYGPLFGMLCLAGAKNDTWVKRHVPKLFFALGDSSYSLYLSHIVTLALLGKICARLVPSLHAFLFVIFGAVLSIIVAHAMYLYIEQKIITILRHRLGRRDT